MAKRAVEDMIERGEAVIHVPTIESARAIETDMRAAGVDVWRVRKIGKINVKALRERLGLATAEAFAMRYRLNPRTVEGWEAGRPIDDIANTYLHTIATNPKSVGEALEEKLT
jgi:DNA-binding transcriptional regulator YiaG